MKRSPLALLDLSYLPQTLAELCWIFSNCREDTYVEKIKRALDIYETLLRLCSITAVSLYLTESDKLQSAEEGSRIKEEILGLESWPSNGRWASALRCIIGSFAKRKSELPDLASYLTDYYRNKLPNGRAGEAFAGLELIAEYISVKAPQPTFGHVIDFLGTTRNKIEAHGAIPNPVDTERLAVALEKVVAELVANASFFRKWQIFYVDKVEKHRGQTVIYEAKSFTNQRVNRIKLTQEHSRFEICVDGEVYLAKIKASDSGDIPIVQSALSLKPYLIYSPCPSTKSDQLFFHNSLQNGNRQYLCYATGAHLSPLNLERDFQNISKVIRGDLRASDVFRPLDGSAERIATPDERRQAVVLAEQALAAVRNGSVESALELANDALRLHRHCAKAFFALGLVLWELRESGEARDAFFKAGELRPNEPAFILALALANTITRDTRSALQAFRALSKIDANNKWSIKALNEPDLLETAIFQRHESTEVRMSAASEAVFQQLDEDSVEIVSWLYRLPPWKQIYTLSQRAHYPISPLLSSLFVAFLFFLIPVSFHFPILMQWGFRSSESLVFFSRHAIIATICFCGLINAFLISSIFKKAYKTLSNMVLVPKNAFRQWFVSEISSAWGSGNGSLRASEVTNLRDLFTYDLKHFLTFVIAFVFFLPVHYLCSGDFSLTSPFPVELNNSLRRAAQYPDIPLAWAIIQTVVRHTIYCLQVYLCVYCIPLLFFIIRLVRKLPRIPIRYFPSIQSSLTLRPLSEIFLSIATLGFIFSVLALIQLFVFNSYSSFPLAAWTYLISVLLGVSWYVCAPSFVVYEVMRLQREKILQEVSVNIERAYNACVKQADGSNFNTLKERSQFIHMIGELCPVFPLSLRGLTLSIFLISGISLSVFLYLYATLILGWPNF